MQHPILKNEFKNPKLEIDPEDGRPVGWQKAYVEAFHEALKDAGAYLFDSVACDAWDGPDPDHKNAVGGAFLAYKDGFGIAEHLALGSLLEGKGWTHKQVRYEFNNGEVLQGALFVPPVEISHREATSVEVAGGVPSGPVIDAFRSVVGKIDADVYQVADEQVWIAGRITRDQHLALRNAGWVTINNVGDDVVYGFYRYSAPDRLLPARGRRTERPQPTNLGTAKEQFARIVTDPLPVWQWDGNSVFATGDAVQRLDFNARNVTFPNQCSALLAAGWRESVTTDPYTGLKTFRYAVPGAQYAPANVWQALTLLQPRGGWFDDGKCISDGNTVRWSSQLNEEAFRVAKSLARQAAGHPCFQILEGYDQITYTFKPGHGF